MSESRETELIKAIIDNLDDSETEYTKTPQSRNEEILVSILNETEYTKTPQSREEELLLELKEKIGGLVPPVPPVIKRVTGNPIEFTDGADAPLVKCVTQITGSQDLHGQDKPWVGGAGKNKLPLTVDGIKSINTGGTWSGNSYTHKGITFTVYTDNANNVVRVGATGTATGGTCYFNLYLNLSLTADIYFSGCSSNGSENTYFLDAYSTNPTHTYRNVGTDILIPSGTTLNEIYIGIRDGYSISSGGLTFYPMIRLATESDPTFAPYSNICPITAYDENTILVGGNEYNGADNFTVFNSGTSIVVQANDKRLTSKGVPVNNNDLVLIKYDNTQFKLSSMFYYDNPTITVGSIANNQIISLENKSGEYKFKATNGGYVYFYFAPNENRNVSPSELSDTIVCVMKDTHTTTFPNAIYRGSEDCVNGTETHDMVVIDLGDLTWTYDPTYARFQSSGIADMKKGDSRTIRLYSSCYESLWHGEPFNANWDSVIYNGIYQNVANICVHDHRYTDATAFKTAVAGQKLAYELATPTTSSVTPTNLPIKSLSGYNHIESSTGEMQVDYITDAYQNFVDTVESALPNTRKSGTKAMDIFLSLDNPKIPDQKEVDEIQNGVKEEIVDDRR